MHLKLQKPSNSKPHTAQSFQSKAGSCLLRLTKARAVYPHIPASWICRCVQLANKVAPYFNCIPCDQECASVFQKTRSNLQGNWNGLHTNHHQIHTGQTEIMSRLCLVPENRIIPRQKILLRIFRCRCEKLKIKVHPTLPIPKAFVSSLFHAPSLFSLLGSLL